VQGAHLVPRALPVVLADPVCLEEV
jgi:hypothetical protein